MTANGKINLTALVAGVALAVLGAVVIFAIQDSPFFLPLTAPINFGMTVGIFISIRFLGRHGEEIMAFVVGIPFASAVWALLARAILRRAFVRESTKQQLWVAVAVFVVAWGMGFLTWVMWQGFHPD